MNNKMKEKQKIERVLTVFSQYLKDTDFYEVFWSEKHGYILLGMEPMYLTKQVLFQHRKHSSSAC